ncbi:MAG: TonB family protein [Novosphingobium sp.]
MPAQVKSAALAAGVHGLALLLVWSGWRSPPPLSLAEERGLQVTTVSLDATDAAKSETSRSKAPAKPQPVPVKPAEAIPQARPVQASASIQPVRLILSEREMVTPVAIAAAPAVGSAGHDQGAAGSGTPSAAQSTIQSPPAPASGEAAPARSMRGADTYAVRVFRHIRAAKEFPADLARTGVRGRVLVRFDVTPDGDVIGVAVVRSSGVAALDALALDQIRSAVPYPRPPRQLDAAHLHFIVPMTYRPAS